MLAGEYPGAQSAAEAADRIQRLLQAGVNSFVDLTYDGELPGYESLLTRGQPHDIHYHRRSIVDHSVPAARSDMAAILDTIGAELAAGRCVYVHCRAGIGRTGMTVGCHLVRTGRTGDAALDRLQELWQQCARSRSWPGIPETEEQIRFVLDWREDFDPTSVPVAARCEGALVGLAVGEALGTLCAGGRHDASTIAPATQSDAIALKIGALAAMTCDAAESLLACKGHNAADQMQRYLESTKGKSTRGALADAAWSADFKRALAAWQWSRKPNTGTHDPANLDAHSLPRSLAAALYKREATADAVDLAAALSRTTQQSPAVLDACRLWTAVLIDALAGSSGTATPGWRQGAALTAVRSRVLRKELDGVAEGRCPPGAGDRQDVVSVLSLALAAFGEGKDFEAGMRIALEASAAATVGALYGSLAGAYRGIDAVPAAWRTALPQQRELSILARRFA